MMEKIEMKKKQTLMNAFPHIMSFKTDEEKLEGQIKVMHQ